MRGDGDGVDLTAEDIVRQIAAEYTLIDERGSEQFFRETAACPASAPIA